MLAFIGLVADGSISASGNVCARAPSAADIAGMGHIVEDPSARHPSERLATATAKLIPI
jgi:hypothetical protein